MRGNARRVASSLLLCVVAALAACASSPPTDTGSVAPEPAADADAATDAPAIARADVEPVAPPAPSACFDPWADENLPAIVDDLERRTFDWFWETTNPANGLVPDRWPRESFSSIAATGFGLTAYGVGVENGWITREQAIERTLATLRFFDTAKQGPQARGISGDRGFFYHFLDMRTGERFGTTELSTVDTTLLLGGVLFAQSYFDRDTAAEREIRAVAERVYGRVDWPSMQVRGELIAMGWHPESGYIAYDWVGYNEAMLVYLLALGSPTHPVAPGAWDAWTRTYDEAWGTYHGREHLGFAPLFGHQYSHVWVDFRGIRDAYMRGKGIDYFENSRRAVLAQRDYAIANPMGWKGYGENVWGLTASDGPADVVRAVDGVERTFKSYTARGAGARHAFDDGTIVPTAAAASLPFAPEIVVPAVQAMHSRYPHAYARYGFLDAFNPTFDFADAPLKHGRLVPGQGWVDTDYLGIDQGPIVLMIANHRNGFVWDVMKRNPHLRRGLQRAGFTGGWLDEAAAGLPAERPSATAGTPAETPAGTALVPRVRPGCGGH